MWFIIFLWDIIALLCLISLVCASLHLAIPVVLFCLSLLQRKLPGALCKAHALSHVVCTVYINYVRVFRVCSIYLHILVKRTKLLIYPLDHLLCARPYQVLHKVLSLYHLFSFQCSVFKTSPSFFTFPTWQGGDSERLSHTLASSSFPALTLWPRLTLELVLSTLLSELPFLMTLSPVCLWQLRLCPSPDQSP